MKRYSGLAKIFLLVMSCLAVNMPANGNESGQDTTLVTVEEKTHASGMPGLQVTFIVDASKDDIWNTLVDYANFQEIFDGIDEIKVVSEDVNGATVEFWIDAVIMDLTYLLRREYSPTRDKITWKRISGDLEEITGSWTISGRSGQDSYTVVYESYVDVGNFIITSVTRFFAKRRAREMAVKLKAWIESKDQAGAH